MQEGNVWKKAQKTPLCGKSFVEQLTVKGILSYHSTKTVVEKGHSMEFSTRNVVEKNDPVMISTKYGRAQGQCRVGGSGRWQCRVRGRGLAGRPLQVPPAAAGWRGEPENS